MRILYCNKYNFRFSGTEAYLFEAMEIMRSRGHETALFSMADARGDPTPFDHHFVAPVDFKNARGVFRKARLGVHAIYSTEAKRKLRALIRDFRPDVAHVRNIYHHLSPSILWELKAQEVPVVYHVNDFKLLCPSYNMVSASGEACERCKHGKFHNVVSSGCYTGGFSESAVLAAEAYVHRSLHTYQQCVDVVLAPTEFVKQKLVESGWEENRILVLPHSQRLPAKAVASPGGEGSVLYIGRLSREKGVADLVATGARLPDLKIVLAGDGPLRGELEAAVRRCGLRNITFVGHVGSAELEKLIAEAQFTVFPSHAYETFGKTILESYAGGRAVIASDLGSRRELVKHGETGLLYPPGDVGQLKSAIEFLAKTPELAQRMGEAGRRLVQDKYSPEEHFLKLSQIYDDLRRKRSVPIVLPNKEHCRIAFIGGRGVAGKYSGIESSYEEVGQRLASSGFRVAAYCRNYFTPDVKTYRGIEVVRLPTIRSKHLDTFVHSLLSTVHACFSDCDVVHFHTLGPALFSYIPRIFGKQTVVTVQGLDWQRKKWSWLARQVLKAGEWASAHFPNRTVVVSRVLQTYYRSRYSKSVLYVPNGTNIRQAGLAHMLASLELAPKRYVLFLGRFSPEKNCDMLIRAFENVATDMKLVLAGGSSHTDAYVAAMRRHQSDRITFLDWLSGESLDELLTNAALFVLPSDLEGMSLALLDAMAAGCCVLASDIPENCEAIADAGATFRHGDVEHLREMLAKLLADESLRTALGEKARDRMQREYLWESVTDQLAQVYRELTVLPVKRVSTVQPIVGSKAA